MTTLLWKQAPGIVKAVGDGKVEAVMSTEVKDRDGDIIRQRFWDLDDFIEHPVFVADHQYDLLHQIGRWDGVKVMEVPGAKDIDGEPAMQLIGTATYYIGKGNERADWAYKLAQMGAAAFSVGFIPDMNKAVEIEDKGMWPAFEFRGQKLLETSQVVVPSNPKAFDGQSGPNLSNRQTNNPIPLTLRHSCNYSAGLKIEWPNWKRPALIKQLNDLRRNIRNYLKPHLSFRS